MCIPNFIMIKTIPEYSAYQAYNDGRIWSKKRGIFLKLNLNKKGYFQVTLRKNGKNKTEKVHRLILQTFEIQPDGKNVCDHVDRNKTNNDISNLRWATIRGNSQNRSDQSQFGHNISITVYGTYEVKIQSGSFGKENYKYIFKTFKTREEAIEFRDEELLKIELGLNINENIIEL